MLALLQHHRDPMAGEQFFAGLHGLGLISGENRCHGNALGQVSVQVYRIDLDLSRAKSVMQLVHS